ncbi:MAG: polysaccharide pyruvyl transferase family protein [Acidobacteriia bacterium]|nr:polysaccharide pyruvyl transferase family protein [Terriglobia bacterium]
MKALVVGWFSFEKMGATAGDLLVRDSVCEWLRRTNYSYDVALAKPFIGGVNWQSVDPAGYSHVIFVCGPFGNGWPISDFLSRFAGRKLIGVNLTMLDSLETWNPFELLIERDSSRTSRPDMAFLSRQCKVPVVGVVLIHPQPEYRDRDLHESANDAIHRLVASREMSPVRIDTRLDRNSTELRTPAEVESLIARMDVVLTTRLHGMVLALKNDVPAVVIDPVAGGAKIRKQADALGWSPVFIADQLNDDEMQKAFEDCLSAEARRKACECRQRAQRILAPVADQFIAGLAGEIVRA